MDIAAVRQGLATNAKTIDNALTCTGYVPDDIAEPAFFPAETDVDFDRTFGGVDALTVTCRILVGRADDLSSQAKLDAYLSRGAATLKNGIQSDKTLGGACDDLQVKRVQGYRFYEHAGVQYVGAELVVFIIGSGA